MERENLKKHDIIWVNGFVNSNEQAVRPHWFLIDKMAGTGHVFTTGQGKDKRSYDLKCYMLSSLNWDNTHKLDICANMYLDRSQSTLGIRTKKDSYIKLDTVYLFDSKTLEYTKTDQLLEKGKEAFTEKKETLRLMRSRNAVCRERRNINNVLPLAQASQLKKEKQDLIFLPRMPYNKHAAYSKANHMSKVVSEELTTPLTSQGCYIAKEHLTELSDILKEFGENDGNGAPCFKSTIVDKMEGKTYEKTLYLQDFKEAFRQNHLSKHETWQQYMEKHPDIPDFTLPENKQLASDDYAYW